MWACTRCAISGHALCTLNMLSFSYQRLHSALMCASMYFHGIWFFWFIVTLENFGDHSPLIIWIGTSFSLQLLLQHSFFLFQSMTVRFSSYNRKYDPVYQTTFPVVTSLWLLQSHLGSQARGWGSSRGMKQAHITLENHAVSGMCLDCNLPACNRLKGSSWRPQGDCIFNHCSQVHQIS